jgi:SNF2 family DNA or RNA helicase
VTNENTIYLPQLEKKMRQQFPWKRKWDEVDSLALDMQELCLKRHKPLLDLKAPHQLYPHQEKAIEFILQRERDIVLGVQGGLLSMEMGLGKTLISLSIIMHEWQPHQCATLVLVPKTLLGNYNMDALKFFHMRVLLWDRQWLQQQFFDFTAETPYKNHVILVSYDTVHALAKSLGWVGASGNKQLLHVAQIFFETPWYRVVCDESHRFSNHKSQLWQALMKLAPGRRLCLTGTAVRNYEDDLFAQFKVMGLNILGHRDWTIKKYHEHQLDRLVFCMSVAESNLHLPPKTIHHHYTDFTEREREVYGLLLHQCQVSMEAFGAKTAHFSHVLSQFLRLRQCCISPLLLASESHIWSGNKLTPSQEKRLVGGAILPEAELDRWVRDIPAGLQSTKMQVLMEIISEIPPGDKVIVYSSWSTVIHMIHWVLQQLGGALMLTGDTKNRDDVVFQFQETGVRYLCMTSVGSQGLTLTAANHIIMMEPSYVPSDIDQAAGRIWRIGQQKACEVWILLVRNSVEERLLEIWDVKQNIRDMLLSKGINHEVMAALLH